MGREQLEALRERLICQLEGHFPAEDLLGLEVEHIWDRDGVRVLIGDKCAEIPYCQLGIGEIHPNEMGAVIQALKQAQPVSYSRRDFAGRIYAYFKAILLDAAGWETQNRHINQPLFAGLKERFERFRAERQEIWELTLPERLARNRIAAQLMSDLLRRGAPGESIPVPKRVAAVQEELKQANLAIASLLAEKHELETVLERYESRFKEALDRAG